MKTTFVSIIGVGCVGSALMHSLITKKNIHIILYDKFKNIGKIKNCLSTDICILTLPTLFEEKKGYNIQAIHDTLSYLEQHQYKGVVVIKSTVLPGTTEELQRQYEKISLFHNPEFMTARSGYSDIENQLQIVIGKPNSNVTDDVLILQRFYHRHYTDAPISVCSSTESEMVKLCCNVFYASKIQIFTEYFDLCTKHTISFSNVMDLMLKNHCIHPMHTKVPGPDGKISFGGMCFPKDTRAFLFHMRQKKTFHKVIESVVQEQMECRDS